MTVGRPGKRRNRLGETDAPALTASWRAASSWNKVSHSREGHMGRGASSCRRRESCSPSSRDRGRKSRSTPPTVRVSPTRMGVRWKTWTPLTWVPPLEPRSVTHQEPDSSRRRAACWRETVEKLRRISAEEERPRIFSQWSMGREPPPGRLSCPHCSGVWGTRSRPRMARTSTSRARMGKRKRTRAVYHQTAWACSVSQVPRSWGKAWKAEIDSDKGTPPFGDGRPAGDCKTRDR